MPFLALRSYLPADHPDKHREIGSETTPADFIDTLLALTAEWGRVLAPHGSICVELGDTYSGSGGAGGDYTNDDGLRAGQQAFKGSASLTKRKGSEWPLAKSLTGIPTLYPWSLAYGRNLLTGQPSPAGQWRIRNIIIWARPNPPVGALGDKFRPATSYITVACKGAKRYFDLDAVRGEYDPRPGGSGMAAGVPRGATGLQGNPAGAPPLDWHTDNHPQDGDWLWKLPTQPYSGSHYATFPLKLPTRLIEAMCPLKVCTVCGKPSERITDSVRLMDGKPTDMAITHPGRASDGGGEYVTERGTWGTQTTTTGWTDCGHDNWRTGIVLDPFAGSGTTIQAAQNVGRHAIGIDLDHRNAELARERVGMFLTVNESDPAA